VSVITAMAHNLRLELHARGILSLGRADCEAIIAAVNRLARISPHAICCSKPACAGGWYSRSTPSSGNAPCVPPLTLRAISGPMQCNKSVTCEAIRS
jgi:hypothetical protein